MDKNDSTAVPSDRQDNLSPGSALLGAILVSGEIPKNFFVKLQADDFSSPTDRWIYTAIQQICNTGKNITIDPIVILEKLRLLKPSVARNYLEQLLQDRMQHCCANNLESYFNLAVTAAEKNKLKRLLDKAIKDLDYQAPDEILANVSEGVCALAKDKATHKIKSFASAGEMWDTEDQSPNPVGLATGFSKLDAYLCGGWQHGQCYVLAGATGSGKTSLALQFAYEALMSGKQVLYVSYEMSTYMLFARMISQVSEVSFHEIVNRTKACDAVQTELHMIKTRIANLPLCCMESAPLIAIRAAAGTLDNLGLIIIDHISIANCTGMGHFSSDIDRHVAIARSVMELAHNTNVPVLALAQLNREAQKAKSVSTTAIYGSSAFENNADAVLMIDRVGRNTDEVQDAKLVIVKNRYNACGTIPLKFFASSTRFMEG